MIKLKRFIYIINSIFKIILAGYCVEFINYSFALLFSLRESIIKIATVIT